MRRRPQWLLGAFSLIGTTAAVYILIVSTADAWPWSDQARARNGSNMSAMERYREGLDRQGQARRAQPRHPSDGGPFRPLPPQPDYTGRWRNR
jgi:hypothetical protein